MARILPLNRKSVTSRSLITTIVLGVVGVMLIAGLVMAIMLASREGGLPGSGRIAVLEINGVIDDDREVLEQLREFRDDASVRGLLVAINSPGGSVGPSQSIYSAIRRMRDEEEIPVIATIGSVGASGGYYVALGADSIYALPGSITGSIGVIMELPQVSGLMEKVGVDMRVVKSAENKDVGSPFREMTEEDRAILSAMVQDVYTQFFNVVVAERDLTAAQVRPLADGRIVSGNQALESGLVDRVGNFDDALAAVGRMSGLGREPNFFFPEEDDRSLLELLVGRESSRAAADLTRSLRSTAAPQLKYVIPF